VTSSSQSPSELHVSSEQEQQVSTGGSDDQAGQSAGHLATRDVSSETVHFNNKLITLSQNFDRNTAEKVEQRLLSALDYTLGDAPPHNDDEMRGVRPNVVSFTAVCNAWARSTLPNAATRAELILNKAMDLYRSGYTEARPNAFTFNAAITAWSRSRDKGAADNAVRLLDVMADFREETGEDDLQPNARCYNLAINAVARSRGNRCADKALALLNRMETLHDEGYPELVPDALTFGSIINAYANDRSDKRASDKAADLLQRMESMHQMGVPNCKPNTFVYNSCLNAFAKAGGPANAEKAGLFLEVMENLSIAEQDDSIKPDSISFSTVINAYANSGWRDAGEKVDVILEKMKMLDVTGDGTVSCNAISYTAAIKAWVNSAKVAARNCSEEEGNEEAEYIQKAKQRAWQILTECALLNLAGDRKCQPSNATYDLVKEVCMLAGDKQGIEEVEAVRRRIDAKSTKKRGDGGRNRRRRSRNSYS